MKIVRFFAMPDLYTFRSPKIRDVMLREMGSRKVWVDPFAGQFSPAQIRNDLEETFEAEHHLDGLEFLRGLDPGSIDGVIFDPPYSPDQALRFYKPKHAGTAGRAEYHARCRDAIAAALRTGGKAVSFGWDSNGIGAKRGFYIRRIYLVNHGALHNDTLITVDIKR